jgi:CubicO group peptidase (beta-lactamase class C family)
VCSSDLGPYSGFGLGFSVRTAQAPDARVPIGEYGWAGAGGTIFYVDPRDDMFVICTIQTLTQGARIHAALKTLIYDAPED